MTSAQGMQYMQSVMPWTTNDPMKLENAINGLAVQADFQNRQWAQKWFENFQFVMGNHYLKWSRQFDFAIDTDYLKGGNSDQKRSQTNISRTVLESLATLIYSQLGDVICDSKYDSSSRGARLARVVESLVECYNERLNLHEEFDVGSVLYVMFSKVYAAVTFNRTMGGTFKRPKQQLVKVPKMTTRANTDPLTGETIVVPTPVMGRDGQPVMIDSFENVIGPDGQPVYEYVKAGDVEVEMLSPFEVASDPMCKTFAKSQWVQRYRVMDYDKFMTEYGDDPGVIASAIDRIQAGVVAAPIRNMAIRHFLRTVFAIPPSMDFSGQLNLTSLFMMRNKVFVIEHYDRPSEGHRKNQTPWLSEGRRCILANGKLAVVSTPQYRMSSGTGWHPLVEAKWLPLAPSTQSSGPMSDTVQKNRELNLVDTLISLALQRQAASTLLVNENAGIDKTKWSGEPGMSFYTSGDPSSAVAYASDKNPMPALAERQREMVKEDVFDVSGAQESIRGERSIGATSGYQARLYEEREKKRTSKASNNWESFVKSIYEKICCCLQQNAIKLDDSVISRILRSTDGEVTVSDVFAFLNGPIDFGVDITLKHDSMSTKSKATKIADMQEAMNIPAVGQRLIDDPAVVDAYLDFLDIEVLRDIKSTHRDRAKKENAIFLDMLAFGDPNALLQAFGADAPVVLWEDDDMIHMLEHARDYLKNFDKYKRNPIMMREFAAHRALHEQNYKAKGGQQTPYLASTAADMEARAEMDAAQPKNVIQELQNLQAMKLQQAQQAEAALKAQGAPAAPATPAPPAPGG